MKQIPDITESELWVVRTTLEERFGRGVDIELADSEIRLSVSDRELTACPVLYWRAEDCNFVVFKTGDRRYRCQFFYRGFQQYGTGVSEYDDLTECVVSLLQTQADHAARERGDLPEKRR
jgi:hypothetical protein